jgi:hypothetical protein
MDRLFRVTFSAKPILVHAKDVEQAQEKAIAYAKQPEANRILIEEAKGKDAGS